MSSLIPPVTLPHRVDFGEVRDTVGDTLLDPGAWDRLRLDTDGPFAISASPQALEALARAHPEIGERMRLLDAHLRATGVERLASYGVGAAVPEQWLRMLAPERELVLTDYAPQTVERLHVLFAGADVRRHDLVCDAPPAADAHLFHRIDTELSNAAWREVMRRFSGERVILVATEILGVSRLRHELRSIAARTPRVSAGWVRNRAAFESLWRATHHAERLELGDLEAWELRPRG